MNQKSSLREDPQFVSAVLTGNNRVEIDVGAEDLSHDATVQPPATGSGIRISAP